MRLAFVSSLVAALAVAGPAAAQTTTVPQTGQIGPGFVTRQPADQWLASGLIGQDIVNAAGENIGVIDDLLLDKGGRVASAVIGVGGFLGIGEKRVAVPFASLTFTSGAAPNQRVVAIALSKDALMAAPDFQQSEKTIFMKAQDKAKAYGSNAWERAGELTEQARKSFEEMRKEQPKAQTQ